MNDIQQLNFSAILFITIFLVDVICFIIYLEEYKKVKGSEGKMKIPLWNDLQLDEI